jgi:hypothetical protein
VETLYENSGEMTSSPMSSSLSAPQFSNDRYNQGSMIYETRNDHGRPTSFDIVQFAGPSKKCRQISPVDVNNGPTTPHEVEVDRTWSFDIMQSCAPFDRLYEGVENESESAAYPETPIKACIHQPSQGSPSYSRFTSDFQLLGVIGTSI